MSISILQNIGYLISNTNSVTNKSTLQVKGDTDVTSFSEILSAACGTWCIVTMRYTRFRFPILPRMYAAIPIAQIWRSPE